MCSVLLIIVLAPLFWYWLGRGFSTTIICYNKNFSSLLIAYLSYKRVLCINRQVNLEFMILEPLHGSI